jgi:hypothetical protein
MCPLLEVSDGTANTLDQYGLLNLTFLMLAIVVLVYVTFGICLFTF